MSCPLQCQWEQNGVEVEEDNEVVGEKVEEDSKAVGAEVEEDHEAVGGLTGLFSKSNIVTDGFLFSCQVSELFLFTDFCKYSSQFWHWFLLN